MNILAAAPGHALPPIPPDWPGWLVIIVIGFFLLRWVLKVLGIIS